MNWSIGDIWAVDLLPYFNGCGLAGTHPLIVTGRIPGQDELYGLPCTSHDKPGSPTYFLPRDASGLSRDSYVLVTQVRCIEEALACRARWLGRLPTNYVEELQRKSRRTLRQRGLA